jgi:hypothetical protein
VTRALVPIVIANASHFDSHQTARCRCGADHHAKDVPAALPRIATRLSRVDPELLADQGIQGAAQRAGQNRVDSPTERPPGMTRTVSGVFHVVVQYPNPVPNAQPAMTSVCQ